MKLKKNEKSLEDGDKPRFLYDWIVIVLKSNCSTNDTIEEIFSKMLRGTALKNIFQNIYSNKNVARYITSWCLNDESFRRDVSRCLTKYELEQHKRRELKKEFERYSTNGTVSPTYFTNLADANDVLGAHWLSLYSNPVDRVGSEFIYRAIEDYKQILKSFFFGFLHQEKCVGIGSKRLNDQTGIFLPVYHRNYHDHRGLFALEKAIRRTGIRTNLKLKLDIYSACHIRARNIYHLRPTVLSSDYDIIRRESCIDNDYTQGYQPDFTFAEPGTVWYNRNC